MIGGKDDVKLVKSLPRVTSRSAPMNLGKVLYLTLGILLILLYSRLEMHIEAR